MNIAPYIRTAKSVITANSPVLLLGTTIAGVVTTGVLSAKAGWKARGIVDDYMLPDEEGRSPGELTFQEKAQLTWMCYATAGISGAGTIAAAVGTHTIHTKRANAMAALYAVTSNKLDDMSAKAEELLGPKKTQQLHNEVSQKAIDRNPVENSEIILLDDGDELCYDEWSGRYFKSSMAKLEHAINMVNRTLVSSSGGEDVSLNELYEWLGLPYIKMGNDFGWSGEPIEGRFGATTAADGRPTISFGFYPAPKSQ